MQKFFGGAFGLTTILSVFSFSYTSDSNPPKIHEADDGSGVMLHKKFLPTHGSRILKVGEGAMESIIRTCLSLLM